MGLHVPLQYAMYVKFVSNTRVLPSIQRTAGAMSFVLVEFAVHNFERFRGFEFQLLFPDGTI